MSAQTTMTARQLKSGGRLAKEVWFMVGINLNHFPLVNNNELVGITSPGYPERTGWIKYA